MAPYGSPRGAVGTKLPARLNMRKLVQGRSSVWRDLFHIAHGDGMVLSCPIVGISSEAHMRRREFITLLGSAALATRSSAFAQPASKVFRVGTLGAGPAMSDTNPVGAALLRGFKQLGYTQGTNLVFERRGA